MDKVEKLLESGKSDTAIRNHFSLVEYGLTDQQVAFHRITGSESKLKKAYLKHIFSAN